MSKTKQVLTSLKQECVAELKALEPEIKRAEETLRKRAALVKDISQFDKAIAALDTNPDKFVTCRMCGCQNPYHANSCVYCGAILPDDNPLHSIGYGRGDDERGDDERGGPFDR